MQADYEFFTDTLKDSLGLVGLATLSCCSQTLNTAVRNSVLGSAANATRLLSSTLDAILKGSDVHREMSAAEWLLAAAPQPAAAAAAVAAQDRLASIPSVPLEWASKLIAAGARVSRQQLVAAARSRVAGVEVWVQALREHVPQQQLEQELTRRTISICIGGQLVSTTAARYCSSVQRKWHRSHLLAAERRRIQLQENCTWMMCTSHSTAQHQQQLFGLWNMWRLSS
jgi:hypothetical protein